VSILAGAGIGALAGILIGRRNQVAAEATPEQAEHLLRRLDDIHERLRLGAPVEKISF
jgi:hypothetical protein